MGNKWRKRLLRLANVKYFNRWVIFCLDLGLSLVATAIGVLGLYSLVGIRLSYVDSSKIVLASILASSVSFLIFKAYKGVIRHSTVRGLWRLGMVAIVKAILLWLMVLLFGLGLSPKACWVGLTADCILTIVLLVSFRVMLLNAYNLILGQVGRRQKRVLIYGTGSESALLATSSSARIFLQTYKVIGFVSFNPQRHNYQLADQPVYTIRNNKDLMDLNVRLRIDGVIFPSVRTAQDERDRLVRFCEEDNLSTLVVPEIEEMRGGEVRRSVRPIRIEDLLGRDEIRINLDEIGNLLSGKTILVTGAAGSIGSEICRQLAHFPIHKLICFDSAETPMHNLRLELEDKYKDLNFVPIIGDVRSDDRLDYVFRNWHPQVVFHAAAYKHVPLMEENPCEAVRTNVYGSRLLADFAVRYGVERFVMISTDKAVNPTNIMGCSKRLAEIYVQSLSLAIARGEVKGTTRFITTRFGNVLGSNGSVIPRFREQIASGGPVTVTHPDIIRFFMTIPEACRLVLEAGTMGNGGEIFVFDMGEPVRIADLARRMIQLSGLKEGKDIEIKYTGLRPGEKLYEEVLSNKENTKETPHEKIRVASVREYAYGDVCRHIDRLSELSKAVDILPMVREMKAFVPEFKSKNSQFEELDEEK
ncbi:MAG TPA: polysaccharide biosynthesis protein [Candidatus Parabacteroides intestinipullorum]|uniref:Polysaccharide biosynthesis protein n=1 Tax=Candidatus Parabacteroides intestinipullorum TaxID=2838723 RepID=A0A9D2BGI3_9BACT|nr:polysaccharide biosynthesis protein [Candidatus Parabacteroides intestinipullorum]